MKVGDLVIMKGGLAAWGIGVIIKETDNGFVVVWPRVPDHWQKHYRLYRPMDCREFWLEVISGGSGKSL